jgi:hypothetical protein
MARTKTRPVGRTPVKRQACEVWLAKQLAVRALPARSILEIGVQSGWGWATIRRAKVNIGARSFKKGQEWWWFDPSTYTSATAPPNGIAIKSAPQWPQIFDRVPDKTASVAQPSLSPTMAAAAVQQEAIESRKAVISETHLPDKSIDNRTKALAPPSPQPGVQARPNLIEHLKPQHEAPKPAEPSRPQFELPKPVEPPKPIESPKPRRLRIWDSELAETRDALISSASFVDLYIIRADIRLRQEQLRAKGLLKEELALNDLVSRISEALEKKKKAENLE